MKLTKEQIKEYLGTQVAADIETTLAFILDKTKTEVDNQVVADVADYADLLSEEAAKIEQMEPDGKEALQAAVRILKLVAEHTEWKLDDIIVVIIDKLVGASKALKKV